MTADLNEAFDVFASSDLTSCSLRVIDVVLHVSSSNIFSLAAATNSYYDQQKPAVRAQTLDLWKKLAGLATENASTETFLIKLLWPTSIGYTVRADVLKFRFMDCEIANHAMDFGDVGGLLQLCPDAGEQVKSIEDLFALAATASGALITGCNQSVYTAETSQGLNEELERRMSFPWLLDTAAPHTRLAIVEGGFNAVLRRGVFDAAKALNIGLVIVDRQHHWLQDAESEHLREEFVAVDMQNDSSFPQRIADALRQLSRPVDGITTFTDRYLQNTSRAAQILGLAHELPEAFRRSVDKSETTKKLPGTAAVISAMNQAVQVTRNLPYPLIVKPVRGSGSVGVHIVKDESEMVAASEQLLEAGKGPLLIETYASGPEIDLNMVLLDGRLLFYEINDDFPKSAELNYYDHPPSFVECLNLFPSKLEIKEQDMLKDTLFKEVTDLGFRNGVFHVEARVNDSSSSYSISAGNLLDLEPCAEKVNGANPSVRLIEVNARAPGYQCNRAAAHAYGVDYYALSLLLALRDHGRVRILSTPFTTAIRYWHAQSFLPAKCGGTFTGGDSLKDFAMRRPDLHKCLVDPVVFFKDGDRVVDPSCGRHMWLATFLVRSRRGRQHVLEVESAVRSYFRDAMLVTKA